MHIDNTELKRSNNVNILQLDISLSNTEDF